MMPHHSSQKGASTLTVLFTTFIGIAILSVVFKLAPLYYDNHLVRGVLNQIDLELMTADTSSRKVKEDVIKMLKLNNVSEITSDAVRVERKAQSIVIDISYERRTPLMFNIDVVVTFNNRKEKKIL